jgi:hypothetical protein
MNIAAAMDSIAQAFTNAGIRTYSYPASSVSVPCAVVAYPEEIDLTLAFGRNGNEATFPVYLLVGKATDKAARNTLSEMLTSAKTALQSIGGSLKARIEEVDVAGVAYLAARLDLDWIE